MKKSELKKIIREEIKRLDEKQEVDPEINDDLKSSRNLKELESKVEQYDLSKGQLMQIAYDGNTKNVDSATPRGIWDKLDKYGGTFWFVMDYQDKKNSLGKLVHLGEKILGIDNNYLKIEK